MSLQQDVMKARALNAAQSSAAKAAQAASVHAAP
jgi:hypothetical protein